MNEDYKHLKDNPFFKDLFKEKEFLESSLLSVYAKLQNETFVENAKPEIIENEMKKKIDAESRLAAIKNELKRRNNKEYVEDFLNKLKPLLPNDFQTLSIEKKKLVLDEVSETFLNSDDYKDL